VLFTLFREPSRWWSAVDLGAKTGLTLESARRRLLQLTAGGITRKRRAGGRTDFQLDPDCPVFSELKSLLQKLVEQEEGRETVLVVEDTDVTAQITRILLENWGFRVFEAHDAGEALAIFEQHASEIQLLLADIKLPGMNGVELAAFLSARKPFLRVLLMSASPAEEPALPNVAFLPKPFNPASLARAVRKQMRSTLRTPAVYPTLQ
jgi:CheY-like chemotaxis protein